MAQLIVRHLDPDLVHQLKIRAAQHGRSMEAEHLEILRQALQASPPQATLVTRNVTDIAGTGVPYLNPFESMSQ